MRGVDDTARWDQRYRERTWTTEPDPWVVTIAGGWAAGRALDLGCGTGRHAIWLAQRGWTVTGVDASAVGLAQAAARAAELGLPVTFVHAAISDYQPPPDGFDLVLLANVHPAPDQRPTMLAQASQAVAPGGRLLVVGHDLDALGRDGPPDPERLYTVERLRDALPQGLAVETLQRVDRASAAATAGRSAEPTVVAVLRRPVVE